MGRINSKLGKPERSILPSKDMRTRNKEQIIQILIKNKNGISHKELAKSLNKDRKTVRPYMKELIKEGFAIREQGKFGKYFATSVVIEENIASEQFGDRLRLLLGKENLIQIRYRSRSKIYYDRQLENSIHEFSNLLGGLVTYVLIKSLDEKNRLLKNRSYEKKKRGDFSFYWPFSIAEQWVEKVLHQLITSEPVGMVFEFHRKVFLDNAEEALLAYSKVYPKLYNELSLLWRSLSKNYEIQERYSSA